MIEFKRNEKTGVLEVWKDGVKIGVIKTLKDDIEEEQSDGV